MQHMIQTEDKKQSFVDFYIMPEETTMDDGEDDGSMTANSDRLGLLEPSQKSPDTTSKHSPSSKQDFTTKDLLAYEQGTRNVYIDTVIATIKRYKRRAK